jgi:DNA repair exonuclease SbcCD ATPase subunit
MVLFKIADDTYVDPNGKPASEAEVQEYLDSLPEASDRDTPENQSEYIAELENVIANLEADSEALAKFWQSAGLPIGTEGVGVDVIEHINATAALVSSQQAQIASLEQQVQDQILVFEDEKNLLKEQVNSLEDEKANLEQTKNDLADFINGLLKAANTDSYENLPAILEAAVKTQTPPAMEPAPKKGK